MASFMDLSIGIVENADRYGFELREHRGGHDPAAAVGSSRHQTGALQVLQPGPPR